MSFLGLRRKLEDSNTATVDSTVLPRKHRPDYQIILFSGILLLLGVVVIYAISPARVELINQGGGNLDTTHFMEKQLISLAVGILGFIAAASLPLNFWRKYAGRLVWTSLALCVALAVLGFAGADSLALCTNGACRWFNTPFGTFQPAEFVKFALLLFIAGFLGRRMAQGKINSLHDTLIPVGVVVAVAGFFIVVLQKDMGTGITLAGMIATMLYVAGLNRKWMAVTALIVAVVGIAAIITSPHRIDRVTTFLNSSGDAEGTSYHITQASIALGSGGFTGRGLGQSIQAFGYLPEAVNDSIFAILGENFGFVGLMSILAVFLALFIRLLDIIDRVADPVYKILVAGVFGWLAVHTVVNIGAMLGVFPLTGVTLPFLSFGGTSLLFILSALGLAFHISRYTTHRIPLNDTQGGKGSEDTRSGRRLGRTRYAGTRSY